MSAHYLEFIAREIPLCLLCTTNKSLVIAIYQVPQPIHPNQRGYTQSELQGLRRFYPFFVQQHWRVVYQPYHVISWDTESWNLTYYPPSIDCTSLISYTYFPTSVSGYFPPLIYFRTSRLGFFPFHGAIFTLLASTKCHGLLSSTHWPPYRKQLHCCRFLLWVG